MIAESKAKSMLNPEKISQRITSFEKRFGEAHLYLAYHAAFPLALTPDLTYRIWANFQKDTKGDFLRNKRGRVLHIPWIAVADLLLSDFCSEVAHELYEMEQPIRNELLKRLRADERFGKERIHQLSQFLLQYIEQQLHSDDPYVRNFANGQKWIVNAYTKPDEVARELAQALSEKVKQNDRAGVIRLASMVETAAEPLIDAGLEYLVIYSESMKAFVRGNIEKAKAEVDKLQEDVRINLHIPENLLTKEVDEDRSQQSDFISSICGNLNRRFGNSACDYYDPSNTQCVLLRKQQMELFWEQCRGEPFVMLYETVQKFLKKLKWRLPAIPIDDHEDIDFEKIVSHLKSHPLNDQFTIAAWYSYMYKTVYMEIEDKVVYKAYGTILIDDEILDDHEPIESILVTKDLILAARKALKERAEDARPGSKAHEIYQRQYEVFHILSEGGTIEAISKAFGVRQKTILRDISEIKIFLEKSLPEISIY